MLDGWTLAAAALTAMSLGSLVFWCTAGILAVRTRLGAPTLRDVLGWPEASPTDSCQSVCVIVPAHNEQRQIGALVTSLRTQDYPKLRVVLALDRCTDGTERAALAAIDGDGRFEIVGVAGCPDRWAGKAHAAWRGYRDSAAAMEADVLVFADADTVFDPACVRAAEAMMRGLDLGMLSLVSTLIGRRWYELAAQPAAALELMRQFPIISANRGRRPFANGQFIAFTRGCYEMIGGHEAVGGALLEDLELARNAAAKGQRLGVALADGLLRCRMYESWGAFVRGWKRIFTEGSKRKPDRLRRHAGTVLTYGFTLPAASLAAAAAGWWWWAVQSRWEGLVMGATGTLSLMSLGLALGWMYRMGRLPVWAAPAFPAGALLTAWVLIRAARDLSGGKPTVWGGRAYAREAR